MSAHWMGAANTHEDPGVRAMKRVADAQLEAQRAIEQTNGEEKLLRNSEAGASDEVPMADLLAAIEGAFIELEQVIQKGRDILSGAAVLTARIYSQEDEKDEEETDPEKDEPLSKEKVKTRVKTKSKSS